MELAGSDRDLIESAYPPEPRPPARRPDGLTLVAIYELVSAVLLLVVFGVLTLYLILALRAEPTGAVSLALDVALALSLIGILFAIASAIVGFGLLGCRGWARTGGMLLAIPALLGLPIWTAFSVLVLIYLHGDEARAAVAPEPGPVGSGEQQGQAEGDEA